MLRGRSAVEVDVDARAELALGLLEVDGGGLAGDIGAGHRHRSHLAQQLDGDRMQRHPQHHGAVRVAEIPLQRRRLQHHQAERAGPERADQFARPVRHPVHQALDRVPGADQHTHRHVAATALGRQQCVHRGAVESVGADAVDGVGRHDDQPAGLERPYRGGDSARPLVGVGAVEDLTH